MQPLLDPSLDPLFWDSLLPDTQSAWHGHVPFAHWLVSVLRPREIVELGTHGGVSYAAFLQAVQRCGIEARCSAVDSWAGDDHAGAYSEDVYAELKTFHDARFSGFSRLLRMGFDDAVAGFEDGSIDLLHIDGFHTYEAVRHDFETWRSKLSRRAVVLFHDTNVRVRGFGVWRFWEEIRGSGVGSLEFPHAFGLGVLLLGPDSPDALRELCQSPPNRVHACFAALGERMILGYERHQAAATVPQQEQEAPAAANIPVDPSIETGTVHIAERFAALPGLHALRLPMDAVTRNAAGCAVWVVSADGLDWRQGCPGTSFDGDSVTLAFAPFQHGRPAHFHLFVTDACAAGAGLPRALADRLGARRPPIAIETPLLDLPKLPSHGLFLWQDGVVSA